MTTLETLAAAAEQSRLADMEARIVSLEDVVQLQREHIAVLESRLGEARTRRPYPLRERLRIIWLMEYFQIPQRRLGETLGVSRASVRRWLKGFEEGRLGRGNEPKEPVNKTPREIAELIWDIFRANPRWWHRIAMTCWGLGVFVAASTVRNLLQGPKPRSASPTAVAATAESKPRQIVAHYPNHVWSVDRTRVWRWRIWPTWVLLTVDHFSRKVITVCPLEGPNAGWIIDALEEAFHRYGPPKYLISDQEGIFTGAAFRTLLSDWNIPHRLGAVGQHGSIAVTERAILTLKQEWLCRVPLIRGLDHLGQLLVDFAVYYNDYRGHMTLAGATPASVYQGQQWRPPGPADKAIVGTIERRFFPDTKTTAYRLAA